jgi:hypothetical protein
LVYIVSSGDVESQRSSCRIGQFQSKSADKLPRHSAEEFHSRLQQQFYVFLLTFNSFSPSIAYKMMKRFQIIIFSQ